MKKLLIYQIGKEKYNMSNLILCTGNLSEVPYILKNTNQEIYSIEELCYYLYHHIATAEDFLFDEDLIQFIHTKLGMPERATILLGLLKEKASLKEMAIALFDSTDLYTRKELEQFVAELDKLETLQSWQKVKQKADSYLESGNYKDASSLLERILQEQKTEHLQESLIGDVYHNLGICKLHRMGVQQAVFYFQEAYERNHKEESKLAYFFALRLAKGEEEYVSALEINKISEEQKQVMQTIFVQCEREAHTSEQYQEIQRIKEMVKKGKVVEYNKAFQVVSNEWKRQYRKQYL